MKEFDLGGLRYPMDTSALENLDQVERRARLLSNLAERLEIERLLFTRVIEADFPDERILEEHAKTLSDIVSSLRAAEAVALDQVPLLPRENSRDVASAGAVTRDKNPIVLGLNSFGRIELHFSTEQEGLELSGFHQCETRGRWTGPTLLSRIDVDLDQLESPLKTMVIQFSNSLVGEVADAVRFFIKKRDNPFSPATVEWREPRAASITLNCECEPVLSLYLMIPKVVRPLPDQRHLGVQVAMLTLSTTEER